MDYIKKTKTKLIALFSAIILWFYVTTVVDPLESKTFKDIPITISNSQLIKEKNLGIFPEETITANITVKTNLSKLKKITKDNLIVYGTISNPVPGKNIVSLSSNLPDSIRNDINPVNATISLESIETVSKEITVIANKKYTHEDYAISLDKESVEISGTKTLVNKVDRIIAKLEDSQEHKDNLTEKLELIPIDINGKKIDNIKLSDKYITVSIEKILIENEVTSDDKNPKEAKK